MRAPSIGALLVLTSLYCFDQALCATDSEYLDACPAYEHYAKFAQYDSTNKFAFGQVDLTRESPAHP